MEYPDPSILGQCHTYSNLDKRFGPGQTRMNNPSDTECLVDPKVMHLLIIGGDREILGQFAMMILLEMFHRYHFDLKWGLNVFRVKTTEFPSNVECLDSLANH